MKIAFDLRLITLTAGTLLPFFWIVVILGHRRRRNFERILFFLCLALVLFFGGSLLALNAQLYYPTVPLALNRFAWVVVCVGLWILPSLLVHLHVEYADVRGLFESRIDKRLWLAAAYVPGILLLQELFLALSTKAHVDFELPSDSLGLGFQLWLVLATLICANWQLRLFRGAPDQTQRKFHRNVGIYFVAMAMWIFLAHGFFRGGLGSELTRTVYGVILALFAIMPLTQLLRNAEKFNFLQIGRQRNLMYAVFAAFVALLYLSLIRRASQWFEPYLPPEATAAILLFLPVAFFEPLQRLMGRILRRTAQSEMDRVHRLMGPIRDAARAGDLLRLQGFAEGWICKELQLAEVTIELNADEKHNRISTTNSGAEEVFAIRQPGRAPGELRARAFGAMFSGETIAALEFLCEQLPAALNLCRLIEEKLRLERELAERERLAVLGQMAASISHNLKNPLGSIKTILQVQMESPEMPDGMRAETRMVLDEISRLSTKLNQLLQFSRPAVRGGTVEASCDAHVVAEEVSGVLKHDAERRSIGLEFDIAPADAWLAASAEAVNEILANLVVNALEATPRGGHVKVSGSKNGNGFLFTIEDDGPGVPESLGEKILQPFFTTKTHGTGLGLGIVARRVAEFGGKLEWKSPVTDEKGTRFEVTLPMNDGRRKEVAR